MTERLGQRSPGRPRDPRKRAAIIAAARHLFFKHGVEAVSIETIAAEAGVSKVTVYGHFGDKETLFEAMVRTEAARIEQVLIDLRRRRAGPRETLADVGVTLLAFLLNPEQQAFAGLVAQEARRHPVLAKRFFEAGPGYMRGQIAEVILDAHLQGLVSVDDAPAAAEDLLALWQGPLALEIRLGLRASPDKAELRGRAERGVDLLFKAYAKG